MRKNPEWPLKEASFGKPQQRSNEDLVRIAPTLHSRGGKTGHRPQGQDIAPSHERFDVCWLTVKQAAEICQVHPKTVRNWIKDGELAATRKGRLIRISLKSLCDFLEKNAL